MTRAFDRRASGESSGRAINRGRGSGTDWPRWQWFTTWAAVAYSPLIAWANSGERAFILPFLLTAMALFVVAMFARRALVRVGLNRLGATCSLSFLLFGLLNGGFVERWAALALTAIATVLAYRWCRFKLFRFLVAGAAVYLALYPFVTWFAQGGIGEVSVLEPSQPVEAVMEGGRPDVVLLVLDGYTSSRVLADVYSHDNTPFERQLESQGFVVSPDALANYGRTRFSVASVVQLGYPVVEGELGNGDYHRLLEYVGGESSLFEWFGSNGYQLVYVESAWFGTKCQEPIDVCVSIPWPDESFYDIAYRSVLRGLPGLETGRSFARSVEHSMDWLGSSLPPLLNDGVAQLVYVHVLLPHPPLFHDSECRLRARDGLSGFTIARPEMTSDEQDRARRLYVEQVQCANTVLTEVAGHAEASGSVVVIMGDHGPDSLGQLYVPGSDWTSAQAAERLGVFLAIRAPDCDVAGVESLVNVGRRLVTCLSSIELADLPTVTFDYRLTSTGREIVEIERPLP